MRAKKGQPNDLTVVSTQLGLSKSEAKKLIIKYLDALAPYDFDAVTWYLEHRGVN